MIKTDESEPNEISDANERSELLLWPQINRHDGKKEKKSKCTWKSAVCVVAVAVAVIGIFVYVKTFTNSGQQESNSNDQALKVANSSRENENSNNFTNPQSTTPSSSTNDPILSYKNAAAVTNGEPCSTVAMNILKKGGKAVDGMIAAMLCDGITVPYSMGIGGGFFMVVYNRENKTAHAIDAREAAPAAAKIDMFHSDPLLSEFDGLAIAVPGEIKGYWAAYENYGGGVPWKELFAPTIDLCENGIVTTKRVATNLQKNKELLKKAPALQKQFSNPTTGELLKEGEIYTRPILGATLRKIAEEGPNALYNGSLTEGLVNDIKKAGGIITAEDLKSYEPRVEDPLVSSLFEKYKMYGVQPPASGVILQFILNIVDNMLPAPHTLASVQRITEAFKYAFGARSYLADPYFTNISKVMDLITSKEYIEKVRKNISDYKTHQDPGYYTDAYAEPKDHGTANIVVMAENGDAAVATSTINLHFGSKVLSESTGIILNNEMDDFSSPNITNYFGVSPTEADFIQPFKRPTSSMCPTIITDDNGDAILLVGAAGGTHITTSVALAIIRTLIGNETIRDAIYNPVFHHQLLPMVWNYESGYSETIVNGMKDIGHDTIELFNTTSYSCTNAIHKKGDVLYATSDYRRPGQVDGY